MENLEGPLGRALSLMQHALELIDSSGEACDVGAHLDLALNRLREHLSATDEPNPLENLAFVDRARC
jgi:hypothetical protein